MIHGRKRLVAALTGLAATVGVSLVPSTTHADPDIDEVETRVNNLYHEAEVAQERFHDAKIKLDELESDLKALKADEAAQQTRVDRMQGAVDEAIVAQYEGNTLSATGQLVLSEDPSEFLSELTTLSSYNDLQAEIVEDYTREAEALEIRRETTADRAAELEKTKESLEAEKDTVEANLAEAEELLAELEAEERAAMEEQASRSTAAPRAPEPASVPASGRASAAVNYALAQVGDAYVYGASGPDAFDCSGLTSMAWAQAGVALPRSSSAQQGAGARVSSDALQPGDLVFYYSPVSHVGIYIGNGQIVHAANPSTGVQITGVFSMPYSGATRPG